MTRADVLQMDVTCGPAAAWSSCAAAVRTWASKGGIPLREVIVLVPFAQLLPSARAAFARESGWQPRVETTRTLADSLGPPSLDGNGPTLDAALDRLAMASLMRQQSFGAEWERRDRRGFDLAVQATVDAGQALLQRGMAITPDDREAFWSLARAQTVAGTGPGVLEGLLLQLAVAWAASGVQAPFDRLHVLRPRAWVVVRAGFVDPLAAALVDACPDTPSLLLQFDPPGDEGAFARHTAGAGPLVSLCEDFESEAWAAAAGVIDALNAGHVPVALVALDRLLVRRVRALLERAGVHVVDETGWRLSTTRAAARVMAWLRALAPEATADDRLDWLKAWPAAQSRPETLQRLELLWRQPQRRGDGEGVAAAQALWALALEALAWARPTGTRSLSFWLSELRRALMTSGEWDSLAADPAGAAVLAALRLDNNEDPRWETLARAQSMTLSAFSAWVDAELEAGSFVPPVGNGQVFTVPLVQTVLRDFGAVVMPGADARHFGTVEAGRGLISDSLAAVLGLPTQADRRQREQLAFAHLLRQRHLTVTRRRLEGDEPLALGPDLLALSLARRSAGAAPLVEVPWMPRTAVVAATPVARPLPQVHADGLPLSLSASQVEAFRACPYRFFARAVLRLQEDEEMERGVEKRDYGTWLHAVLHRFHSQRSTANGTDLIQLLEAAKAETEAAEFSPAEMLPYRASFEAFVPAYLEWLQGVEGQGWSWQTGEASYRATPIGLAPMGLHGRIDRIDQRGDTLRLIDYKTGSATGLANRMKPLSEDTQLAFYAALVLARSSPARLEAAYLTLDDKDAPKLLPHEGVARSAEMLVAGLAGEFARVRAGAALPALGEGTTCEYCEVRGLCRRDHWGDDDRPKDGP